ncbi:MAG: hypothetical protein KAH10_05490 [Flavobacteriales bacterium]|nr:hypothetical protein [Flavobacteriales bacterium]
MKRETYSSVQESEVLIYEETYDSNNNLIHYIDYQARPVSEKKFEYDENNRLIKESEISDGIELQGLEMTYNEKDEVIEQNLFFSGELYESVKTEYNENGFIRTVFQDGEEVHRIENIKDGKDYIQKYYDYDSLSNIMNYTFDKETSSAESLIYDADSNLLNRRLEIFGENGELEVYKQFNASNQLISKHEYHKEGELLKHEIKSDFVRGEVDNKVTYDYDEKNNLVKTETRTDSGKLVEFHVYRYDDRNRMIEENGISNGQFNAIYGTYIEGNKYNFVHKYVV